MNKIIVLLAVVVIITLGALFFCAGFLTGTKINLPTPMTQVNNSNAVNMDEIKKVISSESVSLSEKISNLINRASETIGQSSDKSSDYKIDQNSTSNKLSVDNLLREIIADHADEDDCSVNKTISEIEHAKKINDQPLLVGRKIVFVGYFKNKIALEVQELLTSRGYKAHVEHSKTAPGEESFIFCGPFKKTTTAKNLTNWLNTHGFKEAKVVNIAKEDVDDHVYDLLHGEINLPENEEKTTNEEHAESEELDRLQYPQQQHSNISANNQTMQHQNNVALNNMTNSHMATQNNNITAINNNMANNATMANNNIAPLNNNNMNMTNNNIAKQNVNIASKPFLN